MNILVMGAGYVGMALLQHLQSLPHEVFITTTQESRVEFLKPYGKDVLLLSPNHNQDLWNLIDSCDAVIVLVAPKNSHNYQSTYLDTAQTIVKGLKNRTRSLHLIYTSSTSVYENTSNDWVTENTPLNPVTENTKILIETEKCYLDSYANTCILRLGGIYGPKRELEERAKRLSGKEMAGMGEGPTNHIHLEDIVKAIMFCLDHSLIGVYNLVNDDHPNRKKLYCDLCHSLKIPSPLWNHDPSVSIKGGYKVSNKKIKDSGLILDHPKLFP